MPYSQTSCSRPDLSAAVSHLRERHAHHDPSLQEILRPIINQLEESAEKGDWSSIVKINSMLDEVAASVRLSLPLAMDAKEVVPEGIRGNLERDYRRSVDNLEFYRVIKNGAYKGDYAEFKGLKFAVPKMKAVMEGMSANAIKLYKEMEVREEEPQLQLTPLALKIRTLGENIDDRRNKLKINAADTFAWAGIKEKQLIYQPGTFEVTNDGKSLIITGGKSKSELIKENSGWLVSIVATKPNLNVDPDKVEKEVLIDGQPQKIHLTTAEKTALYMTEARLKGYEGLTYEAYMIAQMDATRRARSLDTLTYAMLTGACFTDQERLAYGDWNEDRPRLYGRLGALHVYGIRFRRSVRVEMNS